MAAPRKRLFLLALKLGWASRKYFVQSLSGFQLHQTMVIQKQRLLFLTATTMIIVELYFMFEWSTVRLARVLKFI